MNVWILIKTNYKKTFFNKQINLNKDWVLYIEESLINLLGKTMTLWL